MYAHTRVTAAVMRAGESERVPPLVRLHRHEEAASVPAPQHGRGAAGALARRLGRRGEEGGRHLLHGGAYLHTSTYNAGDKRVLCVFLTFLLT